MCVAVEEVEFSRGELYGWIWEQCDCINVVSSGVRIWLARSHCNAIWWTLAISRRSSGLW